MAAAALNAAASRVSSLKTAIAGKESAVRTKEAMVKSLEADVQRLVETESFKSVTAPFAGVITRREAEVGSLVNAGNSGKGNQLFSLAGDDSLRIHVNVPQDMSARIKTGQSAGVFIKEFPGVTFKAKVRRTASAVDLSTRTLLTELELDNSEHKLLSGTYADAVFDVPSNGTTMLIPSNALLVNKSGAQVAVVDSIDTVHLKVVSLGKDFGQTVEVLNGLAANDELVVNPPDNLRNDERVDIVNRPKAPTATVAAK
jgi:RND family efflux transporter MFP subunit